MSDEFIALATKEINDEISGIETLLNSCVSNDDISGNSDKFERHTHKIKGLAPMMGKEDLGELSSQLDSLLKEISNGKQVTELSDILSESLVQMKNSMSEPNSDLNLIISKIKQLMSEL